MEFSDVYRLFFNPEEVTEIRGIGAQGKSPAWEGYGDVITGFFNEAPTFARAAAALEKAQVPGIYFVLNPVNPALLARAANRLKAGGKRTSATSDKDVTCLRWIYIDIDAERPSGISATEAELAPAIDLRNKISKALKGRGWGPGIPAMSGNGAHLLLRIPDLPVTPENTNKIKTCLAALGKEFDTEAAHVDQTTFNPSRICKLYGTTARKGDSIPDRPHRVSYIEPRFLEGV